MAAGSSGMKSLKVWSHDRLVRKGVIVQDFNQLKLKCREKFQIDESESINFVLESDGTEIDKEYFDSLEPKETVIVLRSNECWSAKAEADADMIEDAYERVTGIALPILQIVELMTKVFFLSLGIYFIAEMLFLKFVRGAQGTEMIPNYDFWTSLPGYIKHGIMFTCRGCKTESLPDLIRKSALFS